MKEHLIKYYLPVFGLTLALILPKVLTTYGADEFNNVALALSGVTILITLIGGFLNQKFGDKTVENRRRKALKKEAFQQFLKEGFDDNGFSVSGYVDEYFTIISAEQELLQPRKWIEIVILFNPKQQNQFIPTYIFKKLHKVNKKQYEWSANCLTIRNVYGLKFPKYSKIKNMVDEAIIVLKQHNIESIDEYNWEDSIAESVNRHKQISNLKV